MIEIKEFKKTNREYKRITEIHNNVWPMKYLKEDFIKSDKGRDQNLFFKRFIAIESNIIVAFATIRETWEFTKPDYYFMSITVEKKHRCKGIGETLYQQLINSLAKKKIDTLMTETYENFTDAITFLENRGFKQTIRLPRSLLHLEKFDIKKWATIIKSTEKLGIKIIPLSEYSKKSSEWQRRIWNLHIECMKDVPTTVGLTEMPFEAYKKNVLRKMDLQFWQIAVFKNKPIGLSILWQDDANFEKMHTSLTGVLRNFRRKKIATAMKVLNLHQATKVKGIKVVETENEENNPMFQLNIQLGFKPQPAKLGFEKSEIDN